MITSNYGYKKGDNTLSQTKEQYLIKNINVAHRARLSKLDKLAILVTEKIGTMGFFIIILVWTSVWLFWNIFGPAEFRFDPYPSFVLWLFISNLIQLHLLPLLLIGQNIQGKHAQLRADYDYEMDKKTNKEAETILNHLENQQKLMLEILRKIEKLEKR